MTSQFARILADVAAEWGITPADIMGRRQDRIASEARMAAYLLVRERANISFVALGRYFGRDHSTVLHGIEVIRERIAKSPVLALRIERVRNVVHGIDCCPTCGQEYRPATVKTPPRSALHSESPSVRTVLAHLREVAQKRVPAPTEAAIAKATHLSEATVRQCFSVLRKAGLLATRSRGHAGRDILLLKDRRTLFAKPPVRPAEPETPGYLRGERFPPGKLFAGMTDPVAVAANRRGRVLRPAPPRYGASSLELG